MVLATALVLAASKSDSRVLDIKRKEDCQLQLKDITSECQRSMIPQNGILRLRLCCDIIKRRGGNHKSWPPSRATALPQSMPNLMYL
jgi:hypothetical protein